VAVPALADSSDHNRTSAGAITLVFRFDDYSAKSDTALEKAILAAFRRTGTPLTVSVIPRVASVSAFDPSPQEGIDLPEEKIRLLREGLENGGVEVALHGFSHQTVRRKIGNAYLKPFGRYHSEFIGVDEASQVEKIREGREILERQLGVRAETFVPPWNGYDLTTLRVLGELGFTTFSAARRGPVDLASRLHFLPRTCDLKDLKCAGAAARDSISDDPLVVVLFHHYDFVESDPQAGVLSLPDLDKTLEWVSAQPDLRLLTLVEASRLLPDLGARRFYWNRNALLWQVTPPWVNLTIHWPPRGVYLSLPAARRAKVFLWCVVLLLYGSLALVGAAIARFASQRVLRRRAFLTWAARVFCVVALLGLLLYVFWDLEPYWAGVAAISWLAGFCAGLL
jgi:peptidoglycan/xylan/chitin deacetylase (PgdA/CDA1 family)